MNIYFKKILLKPKAYSSSFKRFTSSTQSENTTSNLNNHSFGNDIKKITPVINERQVHISYNKDIMSRIDKGEYVPDMYKMYSTKITDFNKIDHIPHEIDINGAYYKYGLPIINRSLSDISSELTELLESNNDNFYLTATENIMNMFELNKDSSYESLILKYDELFNNEVDMYGNKEEAGEISKIEVCKFGLPIPIEILKNDTMLESFRYYYKYNIDLPGNLEDVHPLKFDANLRPIEDFKYTPVVPIPEKEIIEHKKKIEERRRREEYFELDKSKLRFYGFGLIFVFILYKVFYYISFEAEKINYEVEKLRLKRYRYRPEDFSKL